MKFRSEHLNYSFDCLSGNVDGAKEKPGYSGKRIALPLKTSQPSVVLFWPTVLFCSGSVGNEMVGAAGFEPTTPSPPVKCATRLRYAPTTWAALNKKPRPGRRDYRDGFKAPQSAARLKFAGAQASSSNPPPASSGAAASSASVASSSASCTSSSRANSAFNTRSASGDRAGAAMAGSAA